MHVITLLNNYTLLSKNSKLNYGNRLKIIENFAFSGCVSLKHIKIPVSVTDASYYSVFSGCTNITIEQCLDDVSSLLIYKKEA